MNKELKKCKFSDIEIGSYFKWGNKYYTKIYEKNPNGQHARRNAIGVIEPEVLDFRCSRRESAWVCSFDDDTIVTPTPFFILNTRTEATKVEEALKEIEEMYGYIDINIATCNKANTPQSKAFGKSYEAINKRLTKIRNLLEG